MYTGTYEWLSYPDEGKVGRPILLYVEDGKRWIPAPKYYWKVIHNKNTGMLFSAVVRFKALKVLCNSLMFEVISNVYVAAVKSHNIAE